MLETLQSYKDSLQIVNAKSDSFNKSFFASIFKPKNDFAIVKVKTDENYNVVDYQQIRGFDSGKDDLVLKNYFDKAKAYVKNGEAIVILNASNDQYWKAEIITTYF